MKKAIALIIAMILMATTMCSAIGEELPEFSFRGVKFGTTLEQAKAILGDAEECSDSDASEFDAFLQEYFHTSFESVPEEVASKMYLITSFDVEDVAGYRAWCKALFVRPVIDGKLVEDNDQAIFYAGGYRIEASSNNVDDSIIIYRDILEKMTGLYGEPYEKDIIKGIRTCTNWKIDCDNKPDDGIDCEIDMFSLSTYFVRLNYVWLDAQTLLEEAYSAASDLVIAKPTVDNSKSVNGL